MKRALFLLPLLALGVQPAEAKTTRCKLTPKQVAPSS